MSTTQHQVESPVLDLERHRAFNRLIRAHNAIATHPYNDGCACDECDYLFRVVLTAESTAELVVAADMMEARK